MNLARCRDRVLCMVALSLCTVLGTPLAAQDTHRTASVSGSSAAFDSHSDLAGRGADPLRPHGPLANADLGVTKVDTPDPVSAGTELTYVVALTNLGPDPAANTAWSDTLPAGTTFVSLAAPGGWSCTTPAVGAGGTVSCLIASFAVFSETFSLVVAVDPFVANGTVMANTALVTTTDSDPTPGNDSATATTTVVSLADLSLIKTDAPDPVNAGGNLVYTVTVNNEGPSGATNATMTDPLPASTTFVSLAGPAEWSCTTPAVGAGGTVSCSNPGFAIGSAVFTLTVEVSPGTAAGTLLANTAGVTSATTDPNPGAESATSFTTVGTGQPGLSLLLTDAPDPVTIVQNLAYAIDVSSNLSSTVDPVLTFPLPAGVGFLSLAAPAGWSCATPPVGATGNVSCSAATLAIGTTSFLVSGQVATSLGAGATIDATASLVVDDSGRPVVATDGETTAVLAPVSLSATKTVSGDLTSGGYLTYTLTLTNGGPGALRDLGGDEMVDLLPASLELHSASASAGTATAVTATNTLTWNGTIAAGASVTVTAVARVIAGVGTSVANQATIAWDGDGEGTMNEASGASDDPSTGPAGDPTVFLVEARISVLEIPTLDPFGLGLLVLLLAAGGALALRRRTT